MPNIEAFLRIHNALVCELEFHPVKNISSNSMNYELFLNLLKYKFLLFKAAIRSIQFIF